MSEPATIAVNAFLPHPPEAVWEALTTSDRLADWLMPNDFELEVGHRFTFDTGNWGKTECEVLEIRRQQLLRYSWRNPPSTPKWCGRSCRKGRAPPAARAPRLRP